MKKPNERINRWIQKLIKEELNNVEEESKTVDLSKEVKQLDTICKLLLNISTKVGVNFSGYSIELSKISREIEKIKNNLEEQS